MWRSRSQKHTTREKILTPIWRNWTRRSWRIIKKLLHKQQREFLDAIQQELTLFNYWNDKPVDHISTSCPCLTSYKTFAMRQEAEWDRENKRLKNAKVREILLALELGANRKELEDMLAKMLEEL